MIEENPPPNVHNGIRYWGDGFHDDTYPVQTWVDQAMRTNGTAYFPPGTYRLDAPINMTNILDLSDKQ